MQNRLMIWPLNVVIGMDGDVSENVTNNNTTMQVDSATIQVFQKNLGEAQDILDQNRLLINEINQNHSSKLPHNISRNVGLIRELNNNIRRVIDLYAVLSNNCVKSQEASSEGDSSGTLKSDGKVSQKRPRISWLFELESFSCKSVMDYILLMDKVCFIQEDHETLELLHICITFRLVMTKIFLT